MSSTYKVEYFQVNINVGDCEIILLLEEKGGRPVTIKCSVLIDGGEGHAKPRRNIQRVFGEIKSKYNVTGPFKLDVIVITHWDKDHYEGVLKLLKKDLDSQTSKKVSFLKYDGSGKPLSMLYVPYEVTFDDIKVFWSGGEFGFKYDKGNISVCKYVADRSLMVGNRKKTLQELGKLWVGEPRALGPGGEYQLIGRNLFTDQRPKLDDVVKATSPRALVDAHRAAKFDGATRPGLYCVAANNQFLGVGRGAKGGDDSITNRSSIVCVVIHPDYADYVVSHYLAGDAHQELEAKIIEWTGLTTLSNPIAKVDDKDRISIVKASHHGSDTGTPITMCQTFKPNHFIFSAGDNFRHPNWQVLLYVYSYYASLGDQISPQAEDRINMTSFPYWIQDDKEKVIGSKPLKYRDEIEKFFKSTPSAASSNPIPKFVKAKDREKWIRSMAEDTILSNFSHINKNDQVFTSSTGNHVSYISILLGRKPPVVVNRMDLAFKTLSKKKTTTKRPAPPGGGAPSKKPTPNPISDIVGSAIIEEDKRFYLMSSAVDPGTGLSVRVPKQWDPFVFTLSYGYIALSDKLQSTAQTVRLDETDEWQVWLSSSISPTSEADISQVQISVTGYVTGEELTIDHFGLTISVPTTSSNDNLALTFNRSDIVGPGNHTEFEPTTNFLRFQLADSGDTHISFGDLCKFFDISGDSIVFDSDIDLKLDESSAVWFSPLIENYTCTLRLQASAKFEPDKAPHTDAFLKSLGRLGLWEDTTPLSLTVVAKKTTTTGYFESPRENANNPELILSFDFPLFSIRISCGMDSYTLAIYWKTGAIDAVAKILANIGGSSTEFQDMLNRISRTFDILRVLVEIDRDGEDSKPSIRKFGVDAQLDFAINKSSTSKDVIVMLSFVWPDTVFIGDLYVPDTDGSWKESMPSYEKLLEVKPTVGKSNNLSLLDLIPGVTISTPPKGIPVLISRAAIEVDSTSFILEGVLKAETPSPGTVLPSVSFDTLEINLSYEWSSKALSLYIAALVNLHPPPAGSTDLLSGPDCMGDPGFLFASVEYTDGNWTLTGELKNINFGDLVLFFNKDERNQLVDVLGNVTIRSVFVNCEYGSGEPIKFQFSGSIIIASLWLDFAYNRSSNGWSIEAGLSAADECTLGDIIKSICGPDFPDFDIPDAIRDIKLNIQHDAGSQPPFEDSPVYLKYSKPKDSPSIFFVRLKLDKVQFSFVQTSSQVSDTQTVKKRILVFSLSNFLSSFDIPVIGTVENPVDGLEFVWIHDNGEAPGLTKNEVAAINAEAFKNQTGIVFKEPKASNVAADSDIVLTAGTHFMLLIKDSDKVTVALDYKFGGSKPKGEDEAIASVVSTAEDSGDISNDGGGASKVAAHKTVGPLSVSNIGLQYKDSKIIIVLDATLTLGPITLSLLGFGLGLKLSSTLFSNPQLSDIFVDLRGLAAALDKPPILLAGLLEHITKDGMDIFAGGIAINFNVYGFLALGSYGTVTTVTSSGKFKTFFLFAQLLGPLVELEFATINGVSLGFGYNSHVKYPSIDEILSFPLVKGVSSSTADQAASSSNALIVLSDDVFTKWVTPQNGSLWFAVGLKVLAFESLDVQAVAIIELDPYVSLGIFANAVCSLPPKNPREKAFVYVELGIACRLDIKTGTFSVDGKLSPNSFILHPSCHLSGGFGLYYWFDPSPYAGDFVYTIGGYHPAYTPPSYYPRPQRLAISWQLDSKIGIRGESFFAITPKVCMGGGALSVVYQSGGLRAHLDAHADFLMVWNPFHFIGDIGVSVGVGYRGKVLFWTIHVEIDINASLHLEGPPFGGNVHVDFWVFGFNIYFGSHPNPPPALTLDEFWDLLSRSSNQTGTGSDAGITLLVESGYVQGKSSQVTPKPGEPWLVTAGGFKFNIQCRFALHTVKYKSGSDWTDVCTSPTPPDVYSKPMRTTNAIDSTLRITITKDSEVVPGFAFLQLTKNLPSASWGQYDSNNDPSHGGTPRDLLNGNNSTVKDMLTGVHVIAPKPEYPDDNIPPFSAHEAMFVDILPDAKLPVGKPSAEADAWLPSKTDWEGAKKTWSEHAETSKKLAIAWADAFKWVDHGKLAGGPPTLLVNELEQMYLYTPAITSS